MKKIYFFFFALALILLQSCSMHQKIHFNKDYSGTFKMEINMTEALAFMSMMDTTGSMDGTDLMMEMFGSIDSFGLREKYASIEGVSDVFIEPIDEGSFVIEYKFASLDALNNSQGQLEEVFGELGSEMGGADIPMGANKSPSDFKPFRLNKKTLTHISEPQEESPMDGMGDMEGMEGLGGEEMLSGMGEMFDIKMDYSFARKIKKVEADGLIIEKQDKNFVSTTLDVEKMMEGANYQISFKLK
jgi:hypothetical protein